MMFEYDSGVFFDTDRQIRISFQSTTDPMADNRITGLGFYEDSKLSIRFSFESAIFRFSENHTLSGGRAGGFIYLYFDQILSLYIESCVRLEILASSDHISEQLQKDFSSAFQLYSDLSRRSRTEMIFRMFFLNSSGFFKMDDFAILAGTTTKFHHINFDRLKSRFQEDMKETVAGLENQ